MNQSDPAEGKEANLLLNSESDGAVFASKERLFQSVAPLYLKINSRKLVFGLDLMSYEEPVMTLPARF